MEAHQYSNKDFFKNGIEEVKLIQVYDGDSASFRLKNGSSLLVRFIGINTPEYTKKIEPFGKEAYLFTKERLENAQTIVIEADGEKAEHDATGNRFLAYIWYGDSIDLKLLNLELINASLAKLLIMNNVTKYTAILEDAYRLVKAKGEYIHGPLDQSYQSIYKSVSVSDIIQNSNEYECKTLKVTGIITRLISKSFFITDHKQSIYVYNSYYNIDALKPGDKIRFVAQFSLDQVYGSQLTNIRGVEVLEHNVPYNIKVVEEFNNPLEYFGQVIELNNYYVIGISNISKRTKSYFIDGLLGKCEVMIKVSDGIKPYIKKSTFRKGEFYNLVVGVISNRKSFYEDRVPLFLLCNDGDKEIRMVE